MSTGKEGKSFQSEIFLAIEQITGNKNVIVLKSELVKFGGGLKEGLFLTQLLYWCDKGKSPDGYIYKKYEEWRDETGLSEYQVREAAKKYKGMGILGVKVKKANGNPTVHYKLYRKAFISAFLDFLRIEHTKSKEETTDNADSLTEITTEIFSETIKNKGAKSKDIRPMCFSFKELIEQHDVDEEKAEGISYYMSMYKHRIDTEHPRLTIGQWERIIDGLFECYDSDLERQHQIALESLKRMIDQHFKTDYRDCDYNILHFVSDGVKVHRMYEVAY